MCLWLLLVPFNRISLLSSRSAFTHSMWLVLKCWSLRRSVFRLGFSL
ncbi:unnamed protein product [Brassica napus]|uniref:(rape) hypothetical protein n=1 Tax=Brassica napus TaxID=3708 RepID=A0A816IZA4_BRANA|nr:unnamed protein product [Brassica napus]